VKTTPEELMRNMVTGEVLARNARRFADQEAVVHAGKRFTYGGFNDRVNRLANGLLFLGVQPGDRVAVLLHNGNEILESFLAVNKLGAMAVPLNFRLVAPELAYIVDDAEAGVFIFGVEFSETVAGLRPYLPSVNQFVCVGGSCPGFAQDYEQVIQSAPAGEPLIYVEDNDPAFIMYTAGTTGRPKGAVLTHKNIIQCAVNGIIERGSFLRERCLIVLPVFHVAAWGICLSTVYRGGAMVVQKSFDPETVLKTIAGEKVTQILLVPTMATALLQTAGLDKYPLDSLRTFVVGGAVTPVEVKKKILVAFPNVGLYDAFGQTEMSPTVTMLKPEDVLRKPGSIGKALVNVEIRLVDEFDEDVCPGEVGEAVYRGPTVMKEYFRQPQATAQAMRGGWFHGGDLMRADEDGFYYVVDRKKDMIISGGENIYSAEVEEVLHTHPKIAEAAVIGVPDEKWGEAVRALIVLRPEEEMSEREIIWFCRGRIAGYKIPRSAEFLPVLPRNAAGKVLKRLLR
jgi:acyl-CoA synthetase (AMP-forming)/AMP-acid ligase II